MAKGALSTTASGYALGVLASGLALAIALLLRPVFEANPFLSFFAAIAVSARYGGLGSALLATALGGLASTYFFLHPLYSFGLEDAVTALRLTGYFAVAGIICGLSELWRRERRRVELLAID
ncbi:MAG: DUF4118 domain-containing protein, partial [Chloroflexi bacterium]|nr:DUF4118 domain-containing protein [Chloroflexota bacterium]